MSWNDTPVTASHFDFQPADYKARVFVGPYEPRQNTSGPGWVVFGHHSDYGNSLIKIVATPNGPARPARGWNGRVKCGWRTRKLAKRISDFLNVANPN